jgi:hypothetical protein
MIHIDVELGILRTGAALSSSFKDLLPGTLETSAKQLFMLRRLQILRICSVVPAISSFLVQKGRNKLLAKKIELHLLLCQIAGGFHTSVRMPTLRNTR